tara:strand:- start:1511 stop:1888 length:378 start_codon:yes stop_codon:yes gene_type:complete
VKLPKIIKKRLTIYKIIIMELFEIQGKLIKVENTVKISDKFSYRQFVIELDRQWNKEVMIQLNNDNIGLIDKVAIDDIIEIQFDINCKSYTDKKGQSKWFTNLICKELRVAYQDIDEDNNNNDIF